jgi:SAM-dependent methyltransferase
MELDTKDPEKNLVRAGRETRQAWKSRLEEMDTNIEKIQLPKANGDVPQDQEYCTVVIEGRPRRLRLHDYASIYEVPGLYELLFYDRLKCCSPYRVSRLLADVVRERGQRPQDLRVLDLGAGNGMVGDELRALGVDFIVGVDIIPEAREAALRDRDGIYEDYLIADMTGVSEDKLRELSSNRLNCMTTVATLGFGDIPPKAFARALSLVSCPGWLAFNIKEEFLSKKDPSGFAALVQELNREGILRMEAYRRYRHRLSAVGEPIYYVAVVASKQKPVPASFR